MDKKEKVTTILFIFLVLIILILGGSIYKDNVEEKRELELGAAMNKGYALGNQETILQLMLETDDCKTVIIKIDENRTREFIDLQCALDAIKQIQEGE